MPFARPIAAALVVGCGLVSLARADDLPRTDKLNKSFATLTLTDPDGKAFALADLKEPKAVVVVFLSFDCPVSTGYTPLLTELARTHEKDGVTVVGIVPTDDTAEQVKKHAAEYKLPFKVFPDSKLAAADAFKAQATPEAFVLDRNLILRYRGRIDDSQKSRTQKNGGVTSHDLQDALAAVLVGKDVAVPATKPIGCGIGPKERTVKADAAVTYYKDVAPILQTHCQECHRPDQVGPFSLVTYKQAVNWADDIRDYTKDKKMPPWKPAGGPGYKNARGVPDADVATIARWVDAGCPEGDPKHAPPPRVYSDEWKLGKPDLVLEMPEDYHVGPSGKDIFRCFVFPTALGEDKYIVGYEVRPGNPRVVHHSLNYFNTTGQGLELEKREQAKVRTPGQADYGPGYSAAMYVGFIPDPTLAKPGVPPAGIFGGWAPGQLGTRTPEGTGFLLPNGADVILQIHYHRTGKPETDRTKLGLFFAKKPVDRPYQTIYVGGLSPLNQIPAGIPDYLAKGSVEILTDCILHSVMPHMHLVGRSIKVTLTPPGGPATTLVDIPDWDYNWQETYWFKDPIPVKKGTVVEVSAVYDNSSHNPNNPYSPPQSIVFGEHTTNEMLFGFLGVSSKEAGQRVFVKRQLLDREGKPITGRGVLQQLLTHPRDNGPKKQAEDKKKDGEKQAVEVPYQLTDTKHVRVRVKLNGRGPFNFILDTGAPAAFVTKAVAKAAGLTADEKGWAPVKSFVLEGGLAVDKARVRIEDLFQLEGMNGLGLAGVELHGVIGYDILARYRITYDFTADKLTFVPLDGFTPPAIQGVGGKGQGGLEVLGPLMKTLAAFMGIKPNFDSKPRGTVGIEVEEKDGGVFVKSILDGSPAAAAGLKIGDKLLSVKDRSIDAAKDLSRVLDKLTAGTKVAVRIKRGEETTTLTVELGKGI
jgi:peroxiredoxin